MTTGLSRDEVLRIAKECGYLMDSGRYSTDPKKIERFATSMYAAGAADMKERADELEDLLLNIGNFAHDKSTGPAVPDALWEVRDMAYSANTPTNKGDTSPNLEGEQE